jgi:hypothetical protein
VTDEDLTGKADRPHLDHVHVHPELDREVAGECPVVRVRDADEVVHTVEAEGRADLPGSSCGGAVGERTVVASGRVRGIRLTSPPRDEIDWRLDTLRTRAPRDEQAGEREHRDVDTPRACQ